MSIISDAIQAKCLAFGDRIIKLNDFLLAKAAEDYERHKKEQKQRKFGQKTSSICPQTSSIPLHLQSVAALCNQLLRYIALKEARESLYWLDLLHRNKYLTDEQFKSIYADCEELVKVLVHRCKKLDENGTEK